ncbi:MAG TPA: tripartite tricarboxylate transporter substrate binding protein [Burkholderiales bacterium]|nr:tripartite tricarboxylate transporter substrate binding protein [Burkholderiales bacterium]
MRARHVSLIVALIVAATTPFIATAQSTSAGPGQAYPAKAVRVIVPFPPGAGVDIAIRLVTPKLTEALGQQFVADNRPGAAGNIGAELAARAPADGYTLLAAGAPAAISQTLYPKLGYDLLKDFDAIALVATVPLVLVVHPSLPVSNVKELVALARTKRGELTYASTGNGSTPHLTAEMLKMQTGIQLVHIAYKGTGLAIVDLVAGNVTMMFANSLSVLPHIQSRRLRALAISSAKRSATAPDLPTLSETYPGFESGTWYAFVAPAGTPRDVIGRLNGAIVKALDMPDVREKFHAQGADLLFGTPQESANFMRSEVAKWGKVVKASGARID